MAAIVSSAAAWITAEFITVTGITSLTAAQAVFAASVVAISAGIYELGQVVQPGAQTPAAQKQTVRQAVASRVRAYGEVRVGGTYAFLDDRSSFLYQLIMLNSGEIDSFVEHWLGDEAVTLDGSGNVTSPAIYVDEGPTYLAMIDTVLGTDSQAAFSRLMSAFPGEWTSAHQLKGIACSLVTFLSPPAKYFSAHFPAGLPPYTAVIHAAKVWDPRL